jgi:hypothetical protein
MYSAREIAAWAMAAPEGNIAVSITASATHDLPRDLGQFVKLLHSEGYIFAMWKRTLTDDKKPFWTWHLQRRRRKATQEVMQAMLDVAKERALLPAVQP